MCVSFARSRLVCPDFNISSAFLILSVRALFKSLTRARAEADNSALPRPLELEVARHPGSANAPPLSDSLTSRLLLVKRNRLQLFLRAATSRRFRRRFFSGRVAIHDDDDDDDDDVDELEEEDERTISLFFRPLRICASRLFSS